MKMLSYEKRIDLARKFVADARIGEAKRDDTPTYIVKDVDAVVSAYAADLEALEGVCDNSYTEDIQQAINTLFEGEDLESFLDRHNIAWK